MYNGNNGGFGPMFGNNGMMQGGNEVQPGGMNLLRMMFGQPSPMAGSEVQPGGMNLRRMMFGQPNFGSPTPRPMPMPGYFGGQFPMPRPMPMPNPGFSYGGSMPSPDGGPVRNPGFSYGGGMPSPDGGPMPNPGFSYGGGMPSPDGGPATNPGIPQREFANGNPFYNAKGNLRMRYRPVSDGLMHIPEDSKFMSYDQRTQDMMAYYNPNKRFGEGGFQNGTGPSFEDWQAERERARANYRPSYPEGMQAPPPWTGGRTGNL